MGGLMMISMTLQTLLAPKNYHYLPYDHFLGLKRSLLSSKYVRIVTDHNRFHFKCLGAKIKKVSTQTENEKRRHKIFYMENSKGKNHGGPKTPRNKITMI
mgnify:CR=1 FL=1